VVPDPAPATTTTRRRSRGEAREAPQKVRKPQRKERVTVHLPSHLIDRVRNPVFWTPRLTLASLGEQALGEAVEKLAKERIEPFPPRKSQLRGGRPMK
jgi:hypothetical protein